MTWIFIFLLSFQKQSGLFVWLWFFFFFWGKNLHEVAKTIQRDHLPSSPHFSHQSLYPLEPSCGIKTGHRHCHSEHLEFYVTWSQVYRMTATLQRSSPNATLYSHTHHCPHSESLAICSPAWYIFHVEILYKSDHTVYDLLKLDFFTLHDVLEIHPNCYAQQ